VDRNEDNGPLASSSPKQHNTSETTRASKDTLRILNINFQSIRNKKVLLHNLVETTETDIIIGTETWRNNSIHSSEIIPTDQYNIFRNDREGSKGGGHGVLMAVHNRILIPTTYNSQADMSPHLDALYSKSTSLILFLNAVQQIPIWNIPATFAVKWFGDLRY
jgi:hypothetical protein